MAHSVIWLPVPEAEAVVRPALTRRSPEYLPKDPDDPVAHITLLGPFADLADLDHGMVAELRDFFADVLPFGFRLADLHRFPDGTAYLAPDPAAPFRHLTHGLHRLFPEFPPYAGAFDDVVPHLTVPTAEGEDLSTSVAARLPIQAHAREAALFWWEPGACRTLETFPFGTAAA